MKAENSGAGIEWLSAYCKALHALLNSQRYQKIRASVDFIESTWTPSIERNVDKRISTKRTYEVLHTGKKAEVYSEGRTAAPAVSNSTAELEAASTYNEQT